MKQTELNPTRLVEVSRDEARDISIRIVEHLISKLEWDKTDQKESEWYPFDLQDEIQEIVFKSLDSDICYTCDQHPYSDIDSMCPVCGKLIVDHNKTSAVSCDTVYPEKCITCGKEIINHSYC